MAQRWVQIVLWVALSAVLVGPVAAVTPVAYNLTVQADTTQARPLVPMNLQVSFFFPSTGWSSRVGAVRVSGDTIDVRIEARFNGSQVVLTVLVPQTLDVPVGPLAPGLYTVIATVAPPACIFIFPPPPGCGFSSVQTTARFRVPAPPDGNRAPRAGAEPDLYLAPGDTAQVSGARSLDADGDSLRYRWRAASPLTLVDSTAATALLVAPTVPGSYFVVLAVDDGWAVGTVDTVWVRVTAAALRTHVCELPRAWNMVSLPVAVADSSLAGVLPQARSLFRYAGGYEPVTRFVAGMGYWADLDQPGRLSVRGPTHPDTALVLALPAGWSMVGPGTVPLDVKALCDRVPELISVFGFAGEYENATTMEPGKAYWVNLTTATRLDLSGRTAPTTKALIQGEAKDPEAVLWAEGKGRSQAIALGVAQEELVELPPLPPANVFDARVDVAARVQAWQVPPGRGVYRVRLQGGVDRLRWRNAGDTDWELVIGGAILPLAGDGQVAVAEGAQVLLRQAGAKPPVTALHPAYPNPFNPETTITYDLARTQTVQLCVFAATGQRVRQLVTGNQHAGSYQVQWDGRDDAGVLVGSGVYLAQLRAGRERSVQRMVLMK